MLLDIMRAAIWIACFLGGSILGGVVARAQQPDAGVPAQTEPDGEPEADEEARARFQAGNIAFEQGRYEAALNDFRQSYELSRRPALLFNIGAAAQNLNRDREALEAYEQYLRELPDAENRAAVEARVRILRAALAGEPTSGGGDERQPQSGTPDLTGPLVLFGIAGAGLLTFAITGGLVLAEDSSLSSTCGEESGRAEPCTDAEVSNMQTYTAIADVGWVLAAAAATAGVVWLAVLLSQTRRPEHAMRIAPWATANSAGLVVAGDL